MTFMLLAYTLPSLGYSHACLYIHCLHESIYVSFSDMHMDIVILLGLSQICFFILPIILFCNSEHFSLLFFQGVPIIPSISVIISYKM